MKPVAQFLKDIFTGKDGESFDLGRLLWASSAIFAPFMAGWDTVVNHVHFDIQQFGIGMGTILAAGGAALGLKAKTEPDAPPPPPPGG